MPAWGWFLLGVGVAAVAALCLWFLLRRRGGDGVDRGALADSTSRRAKEELEAETLARRAAESTARKLEEELRNVAERKRRKLEELEDETRERSRDLSDDPDALLARIDEILRGTR